MVRLSAFISAFEDLSTTVRCWYVFDDILPPRPKVLGAVANILERCVGARAKRGVGGTASKVGGFCLTYIYKPKPLSLVSTYAYDGQEMAATRKSERAMCIDLCQKVGGFYPKFSQ